MERGIITNSGRMIRQNTDCVTIQNSISNIDLNYYLLYWDKILMPTNNIIHVAVTNEKQLLKTGIFERPVVKFSNWSTNTKDGSYDLFVIAQSIVANKIIPNDITTDWTLHQIGEQIVIGAEQRIDFNSIKVELINCLPVPSEEVNFQEILEFKENRASELIALHSSIDDLYFEILKSPDKDLQKKKCVSQLKLAIANIEKTSKERFNFLSKYDFTTELNINGKDIVLGLGGGAILDFYASGASIPIATILGGLSSLVTIKASRTTSVEKAKSKLKLNYLADANKKKIIKN